MHKIIDLYTVLNNSIVQCAAINNRISTYIDVTPHNNAAKMGKLYKNTIRSLLIPKTIGPNNYAWGNIDAITNPHAIKDSNIASYNAPLPN